MKALKAISVSFALVMASAILVPSVRAQSTFKRTTHVNFSGPVEIPGKVLPAGDYVIQLDVLPSNETSIVEIRDKDGINTIATLLTIPDDRLTPTGKTVILFRERAGDSPAALRAWFYPGENYGHEFAYPMKEAAQLAAANHMSVPAIADNTSDSDLKGSQVTEAKADSDQGEAANNTSAMASTEQTETVNNQTPAPAANQYQNPPAAEADLNNSQRNNLLASNQPLPKTASSVFLIGLLGSLLLGAGLSLGFFIGGRSQEDGRL
jgi:hypothetical protein